mgnify:CR=1 FL=1
MHFEYSHELDAPLDAVELAVLSPAMGPMLAKALAPGIASVEIVEHVVDGGELRSVLRYQASAPISLFKGRTIAPDALMWETHQTYRIATHEATWEVLPKEQYRRYFRASGRYFLTALPDGRKNMSVAVQAGQKVNAGDMLLTIEAMKMETGLHADRAGTVKALHVTPGAQIDAKDLLIEFEG